MAAIPTFDAYMRVPFEKVAAEPRQTHECSACRGTGRISIRREVAPRCSGFPRYMVRRIEELLDARLEDRHTVAELARSTGYSTSHFFRMFRQSFGITPRAYVMRRRLELAQQLLTRTDRRLADVALRAGFCDQAHLTRSFRKSIGTTPRAFRVLNRSTCDGVVSGAPQPAAC
jgi:AraC-like DNA-binding protein